MSSEILGGAEDVLKGNLGGAWDIKHGYAGAYTDLGIAKKLGGATAAYSLRDIGAMNGPVVRVRRSRDHNERDFNALSISSIEGYITTPETAWNTQPTWSITGGAGNIVSQSSTATTSTLTVFAYGTNSNIQRSDSATHIKAESGDVITVNLTITNLFQDATLHFRNNGSPVQGVTVSNGTADYTITAPSTVTDLAFIDIQTPEDFSNATITFNSVSVTAKNGFVTKWYDQIGSNDLVQPTANDQPKIVDSGNLVVNSDGFGAIALGRFGSGINGQLVFTSGITISNSHSFQYVEYRRNFAFTLVSAVGGGNNRIGRNSGDTLKISRGGTNTFASGITVGSNPFLYTTFLAADGNPSKVHINGVERQNTTYGNETGNSTWAAIGRGDNDNANPILITELILYSSEQSGRTDIEADINSKYSIFS